MVVLINSREGSPDLKKGNIMRTLLVTNTAVLVAAIEQASRESTIEYETLQQLVARIDWQQIKERTQFDLLDEQHQNPTWPPTGRWEGNDQGKDTQEAHDNTI